MLENPYLMAIAQGTPLPKEQELKIIGGYTDMLYLIGHDKETGAPKTRWSNGFNCDIQDMLDTIKVFCECINDISDIYIHDDTGKFIKLSDVCDYYKIPYNKEVNYDSND